MLKFYITAFFQENLKYYVEGFIYGADARGEFWQNLHSSVEKDKNFVFRFR